MEALALVEHNHLNEMSEALRRRMLESNRKDRTSGLRAAILAAVVSENYARAKDEMYDYVAHKTSYPGFQERAERYVSHCADLIQAIDTKRNFPGLASLSLAKQQEIHEKVLGHFEELKHNLKMLERVEREHRLDDSRSTVWVLRTLSQAVLLVLIAAFVVDLRMGMFDSLIKVVDASVDDASTWVVSLVGFK